MLEKQMNCYRSDPKRKFRSQAPDSQHEARSRAPSPQGNVGVLPDSPACSAKQEKPHFSRTSSFELFGATWGLKSACTVKAIYLPGNVRFKTSISHCD